MLGPLKGICRLTSNDRNNRVQYMHVGYFPNHRKLINDPIELALFQPGST